MLLGKSTYKIEFIQEKHSIPLLLNVTSELFTSWRKVRSKLAFEKVRTTVPLSPQIHIVRPIDFPRVGHLFCIERNLWFSSENRTYACKGSCFNISIKGNILDNKSRANVKLPLTISHHDNEIRGTGNWNSERRLSA